MKSFVLLLFFALAKFRTAYCLCGRVPVSACAVLYSQDSCQGKSFQVSFQVTLEDVKLRDWLRSNKADSISVAAGCTLVGYENENGRGRGISISANHSADHHIEDMDKYENMIDEDEIASVECTCGQQEWSRRNVSPVAKRDIQTLLLESTLQTAEWQGDVLGYYDLSSDIVNARHVFRQRGGYNILYYNKEFSAWTVGSRLRNPYGWLYAKSNKMAPPSTGWKYIRELTQEKIGQGNWGTDTTFKLMKNPPSPNNYIRVSTDVKFGDGTSHEVFRWVEGVWLNGKKVYQANPSKFPDGIKYLSDDLHNKGLKLGIYSDAGSVTCSGSLPGSLGYEDLDVSQWVEWGIDYLKYDNCYPRGPDETNIDKYYVDLPRSLLSFPVIYQDPAEETRYLPMASALTAASRNITLEMCLYGWGGVETWGPAAGHIWRTGADIHNNWDSVLWNLDVNDEVRFQAAQGPSRGTWNYPDALFVGNDGLSVTEWKTMFALWCAIKSPLMLGSSLINVHKGDQVHNIIANKNLIAVNQDPLGVQATCTKDCCSHGSLGGITSPQTCYFFKHSWQVWSGPLSGSGWVVVVVNRFDKEKYISLDWAVHAAVEEGTYSITDLWTGEDLGEVIVEGTHGKRMLYTGYLEPHGNWAFRLDPVTK